MTSTSSDPQSPIRSLTIGPHYHFFGYYDKSPWDPTGRYMLAHSAATDAFPSVGDEAGIVLIDLMNANHREIARTTAWNWQMGAQLQWTRWQDDTVVVLFNVRTRNGFGCRMG
jgi:hypothetical protein